MPLTDVKISSALDIAAAASADRNGAIIDLQGWKGFRAVVKFGAIATGAATEVLIQTGATANLSDAAALTGATVAVAADDDNQIVIIEVINPVERYARVVINKDTTNNTEETAIYERFGPWGFQRQPIVNAATDLVTTVTVIRPTEIG